MAKSQKPNFKSFGNKKSGKKTGGGLLDALFTPSKKQTPRTHHKNVKGNGAASSTDAT
jgi:hypothetical protein